uniref:uncharacterized protein LOC120325371 isoform X1 n=1 Tax=Styela clava TaxID=7725 RepID=UPI00193A8FB3|nr:uncharacterized protein LOC120325371 isoform X1 [Styela clava]
MAEEQANVIATITENRAGIVITFTNFVQRDLRLECNVDGRLLPDHGFHIEPDDRIRLEFRTLDGNMQTQYEYRNVAVAGQQILRHSPFPIPVAVIRRDSYHLMRFSILINDVEINGGPVQLRPLGEQNRLLGGDHNFFIENFQSTNAFFGSTCQSVAPSNQMIPDEDGNASGWSGGSGSIRPP